MWDKQSDESNKRHYEANKRYDELSEKYENSLLEIRELRTEVKRLEKEVASLKMIEMQSRLTSLHGEIHNLKDAQAKVLAEVEAKHQKHNAEQKQIYEESLENEQMSESKLDELYKIVNSLKKISRSLASSPFIWAESIINMVRKKKSQ